MFQLNGVKCISHIYVTFCWLTISRIVVILSVLDTPPSKHNTSFSLYVNWSLNRMSCPVKCECVKKKKKCFHYIKHNAKIFCWHLKSYGFFCNTFLRNSSSSGNNYSFLLKLIKQRAQRGPAFTLTWEFSCAGVWAHINRYSSRATLGPGTTDAATVNVTLFFFQTNQKTAWTDRLCSGDCNETTIISSRDWEIGHWPLSIINQQPTSI